jgi:hypothetical protein
MSRLLAVAVIISSLTALADREPFVVKGPVIIGVTTSEAWVTWETSHHQGKASGIECRSGTTNGQTPSVALSTGDAGVQKFEGPDCSRMHRVHLTGLSPSTRYDFALDRPFAGGGAAKGSFTTAPAAPGKVRFVVYGDNRDNPTHEASTRPSHEAVVKAIIANEPEAAFLLHTGDAALNFPVISGEDRGYAEFFDVERPLLSSRALAMAYGNHESIDSAYYDGMLSAAEAAGKPHPHYYSFDWGQVHVAVLDSFEGPALTSEGGQHEPLITDTQSKWLDDDLAAAEAKGQISFLIAHQGAFSHPVKGAGHGGHPDAPKKIVPVMVKHKALAIFAGHDHYYQRGREACVDYMVVGAGGAHSYDPDKTVAGVAKTATVPSYLTVTVDGSKAHGEAHNAKGEVLDSFDFTPAGCPAKK